MTAGAQALFYQLQVAADNDGFVAAPLAVVRGALREERELIELVDAGFCFQFPSGHVVMAQWLVANRRYEKLSHLDSSEYQRLEVNDRGEYYFRDSPGNTGKILANPAKNKSMQEQGNAFQEQGNAFQEHSNTTQPQQRIPSLEELIAEARARPDIRDPEAYARAKLAALQREATAQPRLNPALDYEQRVWTTADDARLEADSAALLARYGLPAADGGDGVEWESQGPGRRA